jgi:threonine dehydrogenase-like Zn-dependent dehydrogenase
MRHSQMIAPARSEVVEGDAPVPGPGEVLVRVTACGVCASELHPWQDGVAHYPHVFGHEPVGVVMAVGPGVTMIEAGQRVTGLFNRAFATEAVAQAHELIAVPNGVADENAMGEPLACLVNAARRTNVALADRVAMVGLGFMGLAMLQLIRLRGPQRIVAIDIREESRQQALALGADEAYHPNDLPDECFVTEFSQWNSARGFDVVIESSGAQAALDLAGKLVRAHGILSIVGYHQGGPRLVDMKMWNWKAIDVVNAHVRRREVLMDAMRVGLDLEAKGLIDLGSLVTHRYGISGVDRAYGDLAAKPAGFIKAVVYPDLP